MAKWREPGEPLDFEECKVARFENDDGDWLEIEYHDDETYLVDSNRFLSEKVFHTTDELLDFLGWGRG